MKDVIIAYINKLHGYKTAVKNLHWSAKNMSEHKLCDDIISLIDDNEDEIAEICQGIHKQIKLNELKPIQYKIVSTDKLLYDLLNDTNEFLNKLNGKRYIGLKSVLENFISELNKFKYLIRFCVKEDFKRNIKQRFNDVKINTVITEQIRKYFN